MITYEVSIVCDSGVCLKPATNGVHKFKDTCHGYITSEEPQEHSDASPVRLLARKEGWEINSKGHWCPECWKAKQAHLNPTEPVK